MDDTFLLCEVFNALFDGQGDQGRQESDGDDQDPPDGVNGQEPAADLHMLEIELPFHSAARLIEIQTLVTGIQCVVRSSRQCSLEPWVTSDNVSDRLFRWFGSLFPGVVIVERF